MSYFLRKAAKATVNFCWSTSFTPTEGILKANKSRENEGNRKIVGKIGLTWKMFWTKGRGNSATRSKIILPLNILHKKIEVNDKNYQK